PAAMVISDLDGDGKSDLVAVNEGTHLVSIFRNTSTGGTISFAPKIDYTPGFYPGSVSAGDLDGDGKPDLAMTNDTTISILRNTSTGGNISFVTATPYFTTNGPVSVVIRDIDCDGKPDLAVANSGVHVISIYINTGTPG